MGKNKQSRGIPWLLVAFLCAYIGLTSVAVVGLLPRQQPAEQPQLTTTIPTEPVLLIPAEPDCQGVFDSLFAQPDWVALYQLAGQEEGKFEDGQAYGRYMQSKIENQTLTYQEVQTDLADTHRYLVYLGEEKVAAFTMTGGPNWALDSLELYFEPAISVVVEAMPEHTVYINGVALDEGYTIRTVHTLAEAYLPQGLHGDRRKWQAVDGLLTEPEVLVLDEDGVLVSMERDDQTGIYRPCEEAAAPMTEVEAALARKAAMADARYAIGEISGVQLKEYFDGNSAVYKMLVTNPRNLQKYTSASIDENDIKVSGFCRYSDTVFSVNVKLTQKIIRTTGTLKVYELYKTYFFTLIDGKYLVTDYTNQNVTEYVEQVRLTFMDQKTQSSVMVATDMTSVAVPMVEDPQFLGWATRTTAENGSILMQVRILPDGTVLGALEPMTLYPVYQTP